MESMRWTPGYVLTSHRNSSGQSAAKKRSKQQKRRSVSLSAAARTPSAIRRRANAMTSSERVELLPEEGGAEERGAHAEVELTQINALVDGTEGSLCLRYAT